MTSVFVAAVDSDRAEAEAVAKALSANGWTVELVVFQGVAADAVAAQRVAEAACLVVLWSSESVRLERLIWAAERAQRRGSLAAIKLDDAVRPVADAPPLDLSHWPHAPDLESLRALLELVQSKAGAAAPTATAAALRDRMSSQSGSPSGSPSGAPSGAPSGSPSGIPRDGRPRSKRARRRLALAGAAVAALGLIVTASIVLFEGRLLPAMQQAAAPAANANADGANLVDGANPFALRAYIEANPNGDRVNIARESLANLERIAWRKAVDAEDALAAMNALSEYRGDFPGGAHAQEASVLEAEKRALISETMRKLRRLGFLSDSLTHNDDELRSAVRSFQTAYRQPTNGKVSAALVTALRAATGEGPDAATTPLMNTVVSSEPLRRFRDCYVCPEMVVLPPGQFTRMVDGVATKVNISYRIAIGRTEVTFEEWDACVADGGCSTRPSDMGWGRGERPVVNISYDDARKFIAWLNRKVSQTYRLPSEAEWEYAARSGSAGSFPFGEATEALCAFGNGADLDSRFSARNPGCKDAYPDRTSPAARFSANAFGLFDMLGNAAEWMADCWSPTLARAPQDGSARLAGCMAGMRAVRGGAYDGVPEALRPDAREGASIAPSPRIGMRVARLMDARSP